MAVHRMLLIQSDGASGDLQGKNVINRLHPGVRCFYRLSQEGVTVGKMTFNTLIKNTELMV